MKKMTVYIGPWGGGAEIKNPRSTDCGLPIWYPRGVPTRSAKNGRVGGGHDLCGVLCELTHINDSGPLVSLSLHCHERPGTVSCVSRQLSRLPPIPRLRLAMVATEHDQQAIVSYAKHTPQRRLAPSVTCVFANGAHLFGPLLTALSPKERVDLHVKSNYIRRTRHAEATSSEGSL